MIQTRQTIKLLLLSLVAGITFSKQSFAFEVNVSTPRENAALQEILSNASLLVTVANEGETNAQDIIAAARADYERLLTVLYQQAYYAPVVKITLDGREAAGLSPLDPGGTIKRAAIRVDPGPLFRFGKAEVTPLGFETELPEGFAPGEVAPVAVIKDAAGAGVDGWRDLGYAKAAIAGQDITADHNDAQLNARIIIAPGPQLKFGELRVDGNEKVRTKRIREIAGLPRGTVYSPEELDRVTTRLRRTGAFNVVSLQEAEEIGPGDTLDITAQVTEAPPRRLTFGAELSSLEGLGVNASWMHRNLFGGAERLRLDGEVSGIGGSTGGIDYSLGARFERPATFQTDMDLYIDTEIESVDEPTYSAESVSLEVGVTKYASERREYAFGLGFRASDTRTALGSRSYAILTLPVSAIHDYRNNELNPTEGYYAEASVMPFLSLYGTDNGVRTNLDLRGYKSVGADDRLTFALRGQLGSIIGPALIDTPADFLYFSGGGGTVRGQKYQSLGVPIGGNLAVGGRSFLGVSGEMRVKTTDKLSLVGFYDTGYIGSEGFPDGSSGKWHSGAGLGVRYDTGIGPIRLDVAVPVSGPGSESGFEIYIGIGQAF